jgi:hypothetical protein
MQVLGIDAHVLKGRAVVAGVLVVREADSTISGEKVFEHVANPHDDPAQQLRALVDHLSTELAGRQLEAVVVRAMDWTRFQREATSRPRYQIEGALLAEARRRVGLVASMNGREIGQLLGVSKAEAEDQARGLVGDEAMIAGAAALAALRLAER